ncbi:MAG: hypothetical protein P8099_00465 [Gemmatimonadota bacterium]|jgi:hypothetical protein
MHDVMRKRIERSLEALPDEQLYQVVDFIEFLQAKYAREQGREPSAFQRFAERVEDQMRLRSVAPKAMRGTMRIMSTASRVLEGITDVGRTLVEPAPRRPADPEKEEGPVGEDEAGGAGGSG